MIINRKNTDIIFLQIDLLGISAIAYLVSGLLYGFFALGYIYDEAVYSFIGCMFGWVLFREKAIRSSHALTLNISAQTELRLLVLIFFSQLIMLGYFFYGGMEYLSSSKVDRYEQVNSLIFLRIPFYASLFCLIILVSEVHKRFVFIKNLLIYMAVFIGVFEMNRELLIIIGLLIVIKLYKHNGRVIIPQGIVGFLIIILSAIFFLVLLKPLLYLVVLGEHYDGGFINFGETVNWYRWLDYAQSRSIDLSQVQKNDFQYSIASFLLPYSPFDSASKIWFRDILGHDYAGMTYGYSGVLWLSHYFKGWTISIPWMSLFYLYSCNFKVQRGLAIILQIGLAVVSYRFFRSEWPLVLKTYLWVFFYPTVIFFIVSRLRVMNKSEVRRGLSS